MSTDIKLSKTQISIINKSGGYFDSWLGKFERKISGKRAVRAGKGFTLFILNKYMNEDMILKS